MTALEVPEVTSRIENLRIDRLREAIHNNRVSFPSQVPVFSKHDRPDLQRKVVQLYFVLGWSCTAIARRHGILRQRVQQILNTWKQRAVQTGYIQNIPPPSCLRRLQKSRFVTELTLPAVLPVGRSSSSQSTTAL